jgi:hypothetical protein
MTNNEPSLGNASETSQAESQQEFSWEPPLHLRDTPEARAQLPALKDLWKAKNQSKDYENLRAAKETEERVELLRLQRMTGGQLSKKADPNDIILEVAVTGDSTAVLNYLVEPWLPCRQVVGFYGRGGTAKSSFLATLAASIGACGHSTLWISTEENDDWIKVRHVKCGGGDGTMYVYKALVTKADNSSRAVSTNFNVYEHLDAAIQKGKRECSLNARKFRDGRERPLRLVVLDTAVALTTWGKGESANDDGAVKRLTAYLRSLCEAHDLTIAIIGHVNKAKHDYMADNVAGSGSWTTSLRQAFIHVYDERSEYSYVVCTVKDTLTGPFAAEYTTHPIHTLATRLDGNSSVLCRVDISAAVWGHRAARGLVSAALGQEEKEQQDRTSPRQVAEAKIIQAVVEMLAKGTPTVDRSQVEQVIGYSPHRRAWVSADYVLAIAHGIEAKRGAHGKITYERKGTNA